MDRGLCSCCGSEYQNCNCSFCEGCGYCTVHQSCCCHPADPNDVEGDDSNDDDEPPDSNYSIIE